MTARRAVTIVDVASRAGVSISSASVALNGRPGVSDATRQRIRDVADELGFVPSVRGKSLSAKRAFALGLVVQRDTAVLETDPFFGAFLGGVESILGGRDYALVLQMAPETADAVQPYRRLASDRRVDGVFLLEIQSDDPRVPVLQDLHLPAVGINALDGFPFPSVRQDHATGIASLVNYLVGVGHTRIAHVTGAPRFIHTHQREAAWRESLTAAGLDPDLALSGDFTYEGGRRAADQLLGIADRPTAVICANDLTAIGLMTRVQELGLSVPEDVSVAGFDGIELGGYLRPTLTTVKTAPAEIGADAARLLLDVIDGVDVSDVDVAPAALLLRESTGPAPKAAGVTARAPRT